MMTIELKQQPGHLTLHDVESVACQATPPQVMIGDDVKTRLSRFREAAEAAIENEPDRPIYGFNRGFGSNVRYPVGYKVVNGEPVRLDDEAYAQARRDLQINLIRSHAANVGPYAPREVVRATMLLRAQSLARGYSTVRLVVVKSLVDMLNAGITPAVPRYGSVSASGDLAPLSHIAATLMGEGRVLLDKMQRAYFGGEEAVRTADYLKVAQDRGLPIFEPCKLEMKEGLALNNGCQYSAAWAALATVRMRRLVQTAALASALGVQAMLGVGRPFREELHALRPHPGSRQVAKWIYALLEGYHFRDATADEKGDFDGDIQDPYNLRCSAQVLGPCFDLIERAKATLELEASSVTDNPIDLNEDHDAYSLDEIVSGGHFHGMPVAVDAYGLLQAASIMARLSNMRCARYVDAQRNKGLGPQVRGPSPAATESGMLIAEYATAGLCNHIWGLTMPSHLMSLSTDSGQEDHVSMAANVAMRAYEAAERLAEILAIELAFGSQALEQRKRDRSVKTRALDEAFGPTPPESKPEPWRGPDAKRNNLPPDLRTVSFEKRWTTDLPTAAYRPGRLTKDAIKAIRSSFPLWRPAPAGAKPSPDEGDRELSWDVMKLADKVLSGEIVRATGYHEFTRH